MFATTMKFSSAEYCDKKKKKCSAEYITEQNLIKNIHLHSYLGTSSLQNITEFGSEYPLSKRKKNLFFPNDNI